MKFIKDIILKKIINQVMIINRFLGIKFLSFSTPTGIKLEF